LTLPKKDTGSGTGYTTLIEWDPGFEKHGFIKDTIKNPASKLINKLREMKCYGGTMFQDISKILLCMIDIYDSGENKISSTPFEHLAENGVEFGFNILLVRSNMIYLGINAYRVMPDGGTLARTRGRPYVKITDDTFTERHYVDYRELQGAAVKNRRALSVARNIAIVEYITGEDTTAIKNIKDYYTRERAKLKYYDEAGSIGFFIVVSGCDFDEDIALTNAHEYNAYTLKNYTNDAYRSCFTSVFSLKDYVESIAEVTFKEQADTKKLNNKTTSLGPHTYPSPEGVETQMPGNSCWKSAKAGCNRSRFGDKIEINVN